LDQISTVTKDSKLSTYSEKFNPKKSRQRWKEKIASELVSHGTPAVKEVEDSVFGSSERQMKS
jgi:hypothetical protein